MKKILLFLPLVVVFVCGQNLKLASTSKWRLAMKTVRAEMKECFKQQTKIKDRQHLPNVCLKKIFLQLFDEVISKDVIRLWKGVKLVRLNEPHPTATSTISARRNYNSNRFDGNKMTTLAGTPPTPSSHKNVTLLEHVANGIHDMVDTHLLQIDIKELSTGVSAKIIGNDGATSSPRHRRRNNMMIAMVFGMTVLGSILVPMGFQFLSVVAGKALLLAKMALLLASINGLKKVASSGIHYGLYQVPDHLGYGYDRGDNKIEY